MEGKGKWMGIVTPLSSVLHPEEARKAAEKVAEAVADKEGELSHLHRFVADNANLINIVKRLPSELHHDITVFLGEGYYAERTCKQAIDILKRRGKTLDSQVDAPEGMINDLRLEASFFRTMLAEAEEGLLEIREEYIEEDPKDNGLKTELEKPDEP